MKHTYLILITLVFFFAKCKKPEKLIAVKTGISTNVEATTANVSGIVIDFGDGLTTYGHCWSSTVSSPELATSDGKTDLGANTSLVDYQSEITGLDAATTYYVRAYASGGGSTAYGATITFTTNDFQLPTLTTSAISSITSTSAISGGNITEDGGQPVLAKGVCWGTSLNPDINGDKTNDGDGLGSFSSNLTDLTSNTTYYVRAYATNATGTSYGDQLTFNTEASTAILSTTEASSISATSANTGGDITSNGGSEVTARGVCWKTSSNPTIEDNVTDNGGGTGTFTSNLTGLSANTTYYAKAYATNSFGTAYGQEINFTTAHGAPSVTTSETDNITTSTAVGGGEVTNNGGESVTERGICWNSTGNPTVDDNEGKKSEGTGTGLYTCSMTGLTNNTTYYVRAYAINSLGTSYGNQTSFSTLDNNMSIQTKEVDNITAISATSGGIITTTGSSTISDKGLCWSKYENPTVADYTVSAGTGEATFDAAVTMLIPNTTYYVRAYATNEFGTVYGEQKTLTSLDAYYQGFEAGSNGVSLGTWNIVSGGAVEGAYCLKSTQADAEVIITRTLTSDGQITFFTHGSRTLFSYGYVYSKVTFFIDDIEQGIFDNLEWGGMKSFPVTAGEHTFKWKHTADPYTGTVFLDYIVMPK